MFPFQQPLFLKAVLGSQKMTAESTGSFHIPPNVLQQPFRLLTSCTRVEHLLHNQQTSIVTQHPQFPLELTLGVVCSMGFVHPMQRTYICHCSIIKSCFTTLTVILIKGETCSKLPFGRISSGSMANELKVAKSECRKLTQTRETLEIWVKSLRVHGEMNSRQMRRGDQSRAQNGTAGSGHREKVTGSSQTEFALTLTRNSMSSLSLRVQPKLIVHLASL